MPEPISAAGGSSPSMGVSALLQRGMRGPEVEAMQRKLVKVGCLTQEKFNTGPGIFGPGTEQAVKTFQSRVNAQAGQELLSVNGIANQATLDKLDEWANRAPPPPPPPSEPLHGLFDRDNFFRAKREVALTFDDGPGPYTEKILDILKRKGVKATFFVQGSQSVNNPRFAQILKRMVDEGHTIGNHTYNHPQLTKFSNDTDKIVSEIRMTQNAVNAALGYSHPMDQFRAPYGAVNDTVRQIIAQMGLNLIGWNEDSRDWDKAHVSDEEVIKNVFEGTYGVEHQKGGVILFHDVHERTSNLLDGVIDRLKSEGFAFRTTGELLQEKYGIANA